MSEMSNQKAKPEFVCTLPKSALDNLIQVRKTFQNTLSENQLLREDTKTARQQIKQLMAKISLMHAKLDQYEIQAGELTDESVSCKVEMSSASNEKGDQTCCVFISGQEKIITFDLEMNHLKQQLQQRDSEILILKQEKESLSAELAQLQKHEASLKETLWNEKTHRENLEQEKKVLEEENKKVLEEQKVVKDTKEMQKKHGRADKRIRGGKDSDSRNGNPREIHPPDVSEHR
ncbi:uncharacterized protein LOC112842389 [Oreochromis niloticus]|uniref:uncharacterized protein LOC112842389 n=1 Tax=Oreochromis niloticus TaxID=8128 RepID=UPI000DF3E1F0|nr:uncharacterized protein LOC112842389 [Oreochromis niloticus]